LEEARFDAEPALNAGFVVERARRDLVAVRPRLPLRDVIESSIQKLMPYAGPHVILVIAHAESEPTSVTTGYLLDLAQQWSVLIHTIHLVSSRPRRRSCRLAAELIGSSVANARRALGQAEPGYSARDTARMLKVISDGTSGTACASEDDLTLTRCADAIAEDIARRDR
jgi:hypothetical protein